MEKGFFFLFRDKRSERAHVSFVCTEKKSNFRRIAESEMGRSELKIKTDKKGVLNESRVQSVTV